MPWWAAVVVAVTGCAVGFAFDAGSGKDLTIVFAALYVAGCVAAVLGVRQSGIFTAVIQPPLILFCAVPGAYFLFHGAKFTGVKDLLINCGYPLIERFPLMLFTSLGVLAIGLLRWYLGLAASRAIGDAGDDTTADEDDGERPGLIARLAALVHRDSEQADKPARPRTRRDHAVRHSARPSRESTTDRRTGKRPANSATRRARPGLDDAADSARDRTRRRRPAREFDTGEPPRPSRQPREEDLRGRPPREIRRDPHSRRGRPTTRSSRFDPYEPIEPYDSAPRPAPRRKPAPGGATTTHHPISQVRYRKDGTAEPRTERPRRPRNPESREYDA
jgi:hypothetical protein